MPNEPRGSRGYEAEDAALGQAGRARSHSAREAAPRSDVGPEGRRRMLDEREARLARGRKPMGPAPDQSAETVPEDAPAPSGEQPGTTPEPPEP